MTTMWSSCSLSALITSTPAWKQRWTSAVGTNGVKSGVASGVAVAEPDGFGAVAVLVVAVAAGVGARWSRRPVAVLPIARWRLSTRAGV
jgi:hypothetical protein